MGHVGERAIGPDREDGHVARAVVGHYENSAARVDRLMHAVAATGLGAIQRLQEAIRGIHRKRSGVAFVAVHGIEVALVRGHHQE
jgi:hypothetical protein